MKSKKFSGVRCAMIVNHQGMDVVFYVRHFTDELAVRCVAKVKKLATSSLRVATSSGTGALVVRNGRPMENYVEVRFGHVQYFGEPMELARSVSHARFARQESVARHAGRPR
jgi:hypothetical protein